MAAYRRVYDSCLLPADCRNQHSFSVQTTAALAQRGNIVIIVVTAMSTLRWLTRSLIKVQVHAIRTNFNFPSNEGPKSACMYICIYNNNNDRLTAFDPGQPG